MNTRADTEGKPAKRRPTRSAGCLLSGVLLAAALAVLSAWGALWSGAPQRWSLERAGKVLGADISGVVGLAPDGIRIATLAVREPGLDAAPLLAVDTLALALSPGLPRKGKRFIPALSVKGAAVVVDGADPERPNYGFVSRFLEQPSSGWNPAPFIPQSMDIENASLELIASGGRLRLDGIGVEADITGLNRLTVRAHSAGSLLLEKAGGGESPLMDRAGVAVDARFSRDGASFAVDMDAALSGEESLRGNARLLEQGDGWSVDAVVDRIELRHPVWGEMAGAWAPVAFAAVSAEDCRISGRISGGVPVLDALAITGTVDGFRAGPPEAPWVAGNLALDIGGGNPDTGYSGAVRLGALPPLRALAAQRENGFSASATFEGVSPAMLAATFPAVAPWTAHLGGVRAWSGDMGIAWAPERMEVAGNLATALAGGGNAALKLDAKRDSATGDLSGTGSLGLDKGMVRADFRRTQAGAQATTTLAGVVPARWWREWTGSAGLDSLSLTLDGETAIALDADGALTARTSLTAPAPGWAGQKFPEDWPLSLKSSLRWAGGALTLDGTAALGGGVEAALAKGSFDTATGRASGMLSLRAELPPLARLAGFPELWGGVRAEAALRRDAKGTVEADLRVTAETLGYGAQSIPYGMELEVSTPVKMQPAPFSLEMGPATVALGGDTMLGVGRAAYGPDAAFTASDIVFESGLAPLVAKGWLAEAEGGAAFRCSSLTGANGALDAHIEYDVTAARLVGKLLDALAEGLLVSGQLNVAPDGWTGAGKFEAELLKVWGASLSGLGMDTRWEGRALHLETLAFGLFGGNVRGGARVGVREAGWPVEASVQVENLDLDRFTKEFKPPSVILTGQVSGSVLAAFSLDGLTGLAVDLSSTEGFSMNKDMVEQLLVSQYMAGMTGGKQVTEVIRDVLGAAPQRAFDSARLVLGMEDGRIAGFARLESAKLNLTVDIKADPAALLEALRAGGEGKAPAPLDVPPQTQYNW